MNMIPVSSSNLAAVGYDAGSRTLRIRFHSGTYDYYGVPLSVYQGLMNSSSKGSYHDINIKKGGYAFVAV
ncbi:KTSC domain-containing protein [Viridibacillus arvi]|uniref:KTSC domain-containing protein n=1 Tax=Viridibacillus arvi TaxID=263475 RepID=UPI00187B22FF|nr:KTSC domain-containing protein [Viridibacillus sp. JNUCC-6]QOV10908.1 KTSC domain-containing protein [Viridibacillus sp. JNUCC-6]